jgi:hypothetical protein
MAVKGEGANPSSLLFGSNDGLCLLKKVVGSRICFMKIGLATGVGLSGFINSGSLLSIFSSELRLLLLKFLKIPPLDLSLFFGPFTGLLQMGHCLVLNVGFSDGRFFDLLCHPQFEQIYLNSTAVFLVSGSLLIPWMGFSSWAII